MLLHEIDVLNDARLRKKLSSFTLKRSLLDNLNDWIKFHANPGSESKSQKHLEGLIAVINDCVISRPVLACCFVGLAAFSLKLAVSAKKLYRTGTVVPNACGFTYFFTRSSILTRSVQAAAIDARGRH